MKKKLNVVALVAFIFILILVVFIGIALVTNKDEEGNVVSYAINMENFKGFIDMPSLAMVVGGTIAAMIFSFPTNVLKDVPKMIGMVFLPKKFEPKKYIEQMVEYCKVARLKGILQLEESANECTDPFMKSALMLIVDANDSEKVQAMLDDSIDFMCERHEANISIWLKASSTAPAFGMIGTLVGLINMLASLDPTDPDSAASLGANMSVALVTTFYGCILAHCMFNPVANQLKYYHNKELLCMQIVEEGALAIISGANPRYVQEKLEMMLSQVQLNGKKGKKGEAASEEKSKK
ncbi:MAG: MotA/TolQ/ExbB proton channel family protein [Oscillospiraceae bacterium]